MALQFNPPEWLIQEYYNRPNPIQQSSDTIKNTLAAYAQHKQQQEQLAFERNNSAQGRAIELAKAKAEYGQDFTNSLNPVYGPEPAPAPVPQAPVQGPMLPGVGLGMAAQQTPASGMGSRLIDEWNRSRGAGMAQAQKTTPPVLGSDPAIEEFNQVGSIEYQRRHGIKGLSKVKDALAIQKGQQESQDVDQSVMTSEAALKAGKIPKGTKIVDLPNTDASNAKQIRNSEGSLRSQYLAQSKDFNEVTRGFQRVVDASKDPSPAGDLALLFGFMKMLDPTSVVRETEFANAENSAGVPERVRQTWNKALSGERLTPAMRSDFLNQANAVYSGQRSVQKRNQQEFERIAASSGLNPRNVIVDTSINENVMQQGPKVGTVEDGYRFKGGNAGDPNSWEKL